MKNQKTMKLKKTLSFETVSLADNEIMTWEEAAKFAERLSGRLPSRLESVLIIEQAGKLEFSIPARWWTNEEYSPMYAWEANRCGSVGVDTKFNGAAAIVIRDTE